MSDQRHPPIKLLTTAELIDAVDTGRARLSYPRQLARSLKPDKTWGEDYNLLTCPACGFDYCHIGDLSHVPTEKGSRVVIAYYGECGHAFDVVMFQHKGQTFDAIENVRHCEQEQWPR